MHSIIISWDDISKKWLVKSSGKRNDETNLRRTPSCRIFNVWNPITEMTKILRELAGTRHSFCCHNFRGSRAPSKLGANSDSSKKREKQGCSAEYHRSDDDSDPDFALKSGEIDLSRGGCRYVISQTPKSQGEFLGVPPFFWDENVAKMWRKSDEKSIFGSKKSIIWRFLSKNWGPKWDSGPRIWDLGPTQNQVQNHEFRVCTKTGPKNGKKWRFSSRIPREQNHFRKCGKYDTLILPTTFWCGQTNFWAPEIFLLLRKYEILENIFLEVTENVDLLFCR